MAGSNQVNCKGKVDKTLDKSVITFEISSLADAPYFVCHALKVSS